MILKQKKFPNLHLFLSSLKKHSRQKLSTAPFLCGELFDSFLPNCLQLKMPYHQQGTSEIAPRTNSASSNVRSYCQLYFPGIIYLSGTGAFLMQLTIKRIWDKAEGKLFPITLACQWLQKKKFFKSIDFFVQMNLQLRSGM